LLLGFAIAFVGSMPMSGPVAVLFMARALNAERRAAALIALGGSLVEAGYALGIAFFLPQWVGRAQGVILGSLALGAVVVSALGAVLVLRPSVLQHDRPTSRRHGFVRGALSSLLNPTLIATWTVAVSTLYANGWLSAHFSSALGFAVGVCVGSLGWFGIVLAATKLLRRGVTPAFLTKVLRGMGVLLVLSGVFLGVRFVLQLTSHQSRQGQPSIVRAGRLLTHAVHGQK
jgi:threonine/homoserine/homoserine lactone efflux protein